MNFVTPGSISQELGACTAKSAVSTFVAPVRRIAHLTSVHSTFDVRIFHKECCTLASAGYHVTLIAPYDRVAWVSGVRIQPVVSRMHRLSRMTRTVSDVFRQAIAAHATVYHFHDPELLPVGVLLKFAGKRVIYDIHEHVSSDILSKHWIRLEFRRPLAALVGVFEQMVSRMFDGVVVATPAIAGRFSSTHRVLVQNFPLMSELVEGKKSPYSQRKANVLYVGSISEMKGARQMVKAMHDMPERLGARLILLGEIEPEKLKQELSITEGWQRVDYLGFRERNTLPDFVNAARVGLVLFHPLPNYEDSQPNKLFEYMSAGLPVIASNFPLWKAIVDKAGCGLVVNPLDPAEISQAITWIMDHPAEAEAMGKRGQEAVRATYNWNTQIEPLLGLYESLFQ